MLAWPDARLETEADAPISAAESLAIEEANASRMLRSIALDLGLEEHLSRVNKQGVERSLGNGVHRNQAAASVEKRHLKILDSVEPVLFAQEVCDSLRGIKERGLKILLPGEALGQ